MIRIAKSSDAHKPWARMTLSNAIRLIQEALFRADDEYGAVVFDEWFLVSLVGLDRTVLHYTGPRYEHDARSFIEDIRPLGKELVEHKHRIGNVDFAPDGIGPGFDVMVTLGAGFFAIFNNTTGSTDELSNRPEWRRVEDVMIGMGRKFLSDPVVIEP